LILRTPQKCNLRDAHPRLIESALTERLKAPLINSAGTHAITLMPLKSGRSACLQRFR